MKDTNKTEKTHMLYFYSSCHNHSLHFCTKLQLQFTRYNYKSYNSQGLIATIKDRIPLLLATTVVTTPIGLRPILSQRVAGPIGETSK